MSEDTFDIVIIGAGMIGAAAARHLSIHEEQLKVCLIGPNEPADKKTSIQSNYGSHYDEGRIVTLVDDLYKDKGIIIRRAIERYRDLEQQSGVNFFTETGTLVIAQEGKKFINTIRQRVNDLRVEVEEFDHSALAKKFPYLKLQKPCRGYFEKTSAGYISARGIVEAQKIVAERNSCKLVNDSAVKIEQCEGSNLLFVHIEKGEKIQTRKVLIATGGFTKFNSGLLGPKQLKLVTYTEPTIKYSLGKDEVKRLCGMPCICYEDEANQNTQLDNTCYILPPILYPDGKYYLKLGQGSAISQELKSREEMVDWFRGDVLESERAFLIRVLEELLPDLKPESIVTDTCVITKTPTHHLYIGMISDQVGVAVGGNGDTAKSADEVGNIAARMMIKGDWDYDVPQDVFLPQFI